MCWLSVFMFLIVSFSVPVFFLLRSGVFPIHNVSDVCLPVLLLFSCFCLWLNFPSLISALCISTLQCCLCLDSVVVVVV
jgi:hypothetical protein